MSDFRSSRIGPYVRWRNREINRFKVIPKARDGNTVSPKNFKKWEKNRNDICSNSKLKNPIFSSNNRTYISENLPCQNLSPGNHVTFWIFSISDWKLWFLINLYKVWLIAKWNRSNNRLTDQGYFGKQNWPTLVTFNCFKTKKFKSSIDSSGQVKFIFCLEFQIWTTPRPFTWLKLSIMKQNAVEIGLR